MVTRRDVIAGSAAALVSQLGREGISFAVAKSGQAQKTIVRQGALSAGGFIQAITISNDGATRMISYDGSNAWIWSDRTSRWENLFSQDRLPQRYRTWGQDPYHTRSFSAPAIAVSPSHSERIYVVASEPENRPSLVWRSDDRGRSWIDTGYRIGVSTATPRGLGPVIAVDPNNPDVVYVSDDAGVVHRTFDAGASWEKPVACSSALLLARAQQPSNVRASLLVLNSVPQGVAVPPKGIHVYVSVASGKGSITNTNYVAKIDGNIVKLLLPISGNGVVAGDVLAFGGRAAIVFDPSSSVAEGKTQRIYIGWSYGATSVYRSEDGGKSFSALKGGPDRIRRMAISPDGELYVCAHALLADRTQTNAWKYSSGTWTNLAIKSPGTGNVWSSCAVDPLEPSRVAFACDSGNLNVSGDRGASWYLRESKNTRVADDVPWLGPLGTIENWQTNSMIMFDPVERGKLWIAEGVGVWHCNPPVAPGTIPEIKIISQNKNQQSLIVDQITKPPGQALVLAVQDRCGFRIPDVDREPDSDFGIFEKNGPLSRVAHGWAIDYAKNEPNFQVCIVGGYAWKSEDGGRSWMRITGQPPHVNVGGCVAVQTRSNFVRFPANNGMPAYTRDGGNTWTSCLFNGSTMDHGWAFSIYLNRHMVCCDLVDPETYYAYSYNNNSTGGLWRSTDGGANWENMSKGIGRLLNIGSADFQLVAIPGKKGHLMFGGGSAYNNTFPLMRSVDGGASWRGVFGTKVCWQVAAGKSAPGAKYPSIFMTGLLAGDKRSGIFRSDNFTDNVDDGVRWVRLCEAPAGNMDGPKTLCADYEEYGTFYLGFGSTGYAYGRLES